MRIRSCYLSSVIVRALLAVSFSGTVAAQQLASADSPVFSDVTIKPSLGSSRHHLEFDGQHFVATNWPLAELVRFAYGLPYVAQVKGGPEWMRSVDYDIDARVGRASGDVPANSTLQPRSGFPSGYPAIQALLRDRFRLVGHTERGQIPALSLVVAKGGPKLKPALLGAHRQPGVYDGPLTGILEGKSATIDMLAEALRRSVSVPLFDETGLPGAYDFTLRWDQSTNSAKTTVPAPYQGANAMFGRSLAAQCERGQLQNECLIDRVAPSLASALQGELGLELKPTRHWMDTIVIDHIDRPEAE